MDFKIPSGLTEMMQDFTVVALRERPHDIIEFAAEYFTQLRDNREDEPSTKRGVSFNVMRATSSDISSDGDIEPPKTNYIRRQSVCAEAYNPDDDDSDDDSGHVIHPKTDAQRKRLNEAVRNILLFKDLHIEQLNEVLDAIFEVKTTPGQKIIEQGDDGDNFYVIDKGSFDIFVKGSDGIDKKVGAYNNKGSFGELALMYNEPRKATIIATTDGVVWALDRVIFRKIVLKAAHKKRKMHEQLIECVPLLKNIEDNERLNVADALESKTFEDGDLIIKQGDEADNMYFIEQGEVSVKMTKSEEESEQMEVTKLTEGDYFGELALVTHQPRAASVYAVGSCRMAALDVKAFERLMGPCMDIMKRNIEDYEEQLDKLGLSHRDLRSVPVEM